MLYSPAVLVAWRWSQTTIPDLRGAARDAAIKHCEEHRLGDKWYTQLAGAPCLGRLGVRIGYDHQPGLTADRAGDPEPGVGGAHLQLVARGGSISGDAHRLANMQRTPVDREVHLRRHATSGSQLGVNRSGGKSQQASHLTQIGVLGVADDAIGPGGDCERPQVPSGALQ